MRLLLRTVLLLCILGPHNRMVHGIDSLALSVGPDGNAYCKVCYKTVTAPERPQIITDTSQIPAEDDKEGCPRCGGKNFENIL